jgi:hypothetical protein
MTTTIFRTPLSADFTQIGNDLLCSAMPAKAQKVLLYLLSKPPEWQLRFNDIKHKLGLSAYAARKALKWLSDNGYAIYQRLKTGHTVWKFYDTPQDIPNNPPSPDLKPHVEKPQVENQPVLKTQKKPVKLNSTTEPVLPALTSQPSPATPTVVVASSPETIQTKTETIPGLAPAHQSIAQNALHGLSAEQITSVLAVFAHALAKQTLTNPVGYFIQLTKAAQNGTLTPVNTPYQETAAERIAKQKKRAQQEAQRGKISYEEWVKRMKQQFGDQFKETPLPNALSRSKAWFGKAHPDARCLATQSVAV